MKKQIAIVCLVLFGCATQPKNSAIEVVPTTVKKGSFTAVDKPPIKIAPLPEAKEVKPDVVISKVAKTVPLLTSWELKEGHTIGRELQDWGKRAGWKVIWQLDKDWEVPANTLLTGDFKTVATKVIETLTVNGILIRARFFDGNKTLLVVGPGVSEQ